MPAFGKPVQFDTPEADAILSSALEAFPPDNPWNIPVDEWPVAPNLGGYDRGDRREQAAAVQPRYGFRPGPAGAAQGRREVDGLCGRISMPGCSPHHDATIEGWPANYRRDAATKGLTLDDVQRGKPSLDADRHGIVVDPVHCKLYEFYRLTKTDAGWTAEQASVFDLASNKLRPDGWTSSDAAGLPVFPAVVRYDELKRGKIEHALRATFHNTRSAYVYPATHLASRKKDENFPRMGERFRLRKDFDTSRFSPEVKTILRASNVTEC